MRIHARNFVEQFSQMVRYLRRQQTFKCYKVSCCAFASCVAMFLHHPNCTEMQRVWQRNVIVSLCTVYSKVDTVLSSAYAWWTERFNFYSGFLPSATVSLRRNECRLQVRWWFCFAGTRLTKTRLA